MVDHVLQLARGHAADGARAARRRAQGRAGGLLDELRAQGFVRVRVDGKVHELDELPKLQRNVKHTVEVVVDRLKVRPGCEAAAGRIVRDGAAARRRPRARGGDGSRQGAPLLGALRLPASAATRSPELEPRLFSFNNPMGACPRCDGLGTVSFFDPQRVVALPELSLASGAIKGWDRRNQFYFQMLQSLASHYGFDLDSRGQSCPKRVQQACCTAPAARRSASLTRASAAAAHSTRARLRRRAAQPRAPLSRDRFAGRARRAGEVPQHAALPGMRRHAAAARSAPRARSPAGRIYEIARLPLRDTHRISSQRARARRARKHAIAERIVREIVEPPRVPGQRRPRLPVARSRRGHALGRRGAAHPSREPDRLRPDRRHVRARRAVDRAAPARQRAAARRRCSACATSATRSSWSSTTRRRSAPPTTWSTWAPARASTADASSRRARPRDIARIAESLTGPVSERRRAHRACRALRHRPSAEAQLTIRGASGNNLKNVTSTLPVGLFVCVTGVSGSGKSTLVNDTLYSAVARQLYGSVGRAGAARRDHRARALRQGRQRRPEPDRPHAALQPGDLHRACSRRSASSSPACRRRASAATAPGRFSFNVKGGRCEACQGDGVLKVEMHFLPDIYVPCDVCHGKRYNRETLEIQYKGRNIHEVLEMTVEQATEFFSRGAGDRAQAADAARRRPRLHHSSARARPRSRAAKRSA